MNYVRKTTNCECRQRKIDNWHRYVQRRLRPFYPRGSPTQHPQRTSKRSRWNYPSPQAMPPLWEGCLKTRLLLSVTLLWQNLFFSCRTMLISLSCLTHISADRIIDPYQAFRRIIFVKTPANESSVHSGNRSHALLSGSIRFR